MLEKESGERTGQPLLAGKIRQDNKLMMMMMKQLSLLHLFFVVSFLAIMLCSIEFCIKRAPKMLYFICFKSPVFMLAVVST